MLLSPRKNGLTSLFKGVKVFKVPQNPAGLICPLYHLSLPQAFLGLLRPKRYPPQVVARPQAQELGFGMRKTCETSGVWETQGGMEGIERKSGVDGARKKRRESETEKKRR